MFLTNWYFSELLLYVHVHHGSLYVMFSMLETKLLHVNSLGFFKNSLKNKVKKSITTFNFLCAIKYTVSFVNGHEAPRTLISFGGRFLQLLLR